MSIGIVDTTVLIHISRGNEAAIAWLKTQGNLGVTSISWLELIYGAQSKKHQSLALSLLQNFETLYLIQQDQAWAMQQLLNQRLSAGVAANDCLIASIAHRLQLPLFTHNTKDLRKVLPASLVIQPY